MLTYNCKNMETARHAVGELSKKADVMLIQDHWYFDCQLNKLEKVCELLTGTRKVVDTGDPIMPTQMPRGYGGVAVLWKKSIGHLVTPIPDGGNRIQGVEIAGDKPTLLLSVYMPCRGIKDNIEDYEDCLAQVHGILQKFRTTHYIIIGGGGDFNMDITYHKSSRRKNSLNQVISENELTTSINRKTYVNPNGVDVSDLDYIFYSDDLRHKVKSTRRLDDVHSSVSNHYPVLCTVELEVNSTPDINLMYAPVFSDQMG